jgi:hypothetical protein
VITLLAFFYALFAAIVPVINTETAWPAPWSKDNGRSIFDGSKNAIAREAGAFLKCEFGFPSESICEQMDNNFLREMRP